MIGWFFVALIVLVIVTGGIQQLWSTRTQTGVVQNIRYTWGSRGQQIITINNVDYAMWMNYTDFPPVGSIVTHRPYTDDGMLSTRILKNELQ